MSPIDSMTGDLSTGTIPYYSNINSSPAACTYTHAAVEHATKRSQLRGGGGAGSFRSLFVRRLRFGARLFHWPSYATAALAGAVPS